MPNAVQSTCPGTRAPQASPPAPSHWVKRQSEPPQPLGFCFSMWAIASSGSMARIRPTDRMMPTPPWPVAW